MKIISFLLFSFGAVLTTSAQMRKYVEIYPGEKVMEMISKEVLYAYPSFLPGYVIHANGEISNYTINYNILFDQMEQIKGKDTFKLEVKNNESVIIGRDTFGKDLFHFQLLKDYGKIKLIRRKTFVFLNRYRPEENRSIITEAGLVVNQGQFLKDIVSKDTLRMGVFDMYYMADAKNKTQSLHRENLFEIYPHRKKALQEYLRIRTVSLLNRKQIEDMLDFVTRKQDN